MSSRRKGLLVFSHFPHLVTEHLDVKVLTQAVILENKDRSHNLGTRKNLSESGSLAALELHICLRLSTLGPFHLKEK